MGRRRSRRQSRNRRCRRAARRRPSARRRRRAKRPWPSPRSGSEGSPLPPDRTGPRPARGGRRFASQPPSSRQCSRSPPAAPERLIAIAAPAPDIRAGNAGAVSRKRPGTMGADCINVGYWAKLEDGRIECRLCPRFCHMRPGQRGLCFVRRAREDGEGMELTGYGRSTGFCVDPIEKKPLNHFLPGSSVLSFGTAGCNLACSFCQNHDISKSREVARLSSAATPETIARAAESLGCASVAYTYNDPVIFMEYALDTTAACRAKGIKNVAVTAGFICEEPRKRFFGGMDAANVDLKAFTERFYEKRCVGSLKPVLETLKYLVHETSVWTEVTTLLIPGENDSDEEIEALTAWVARDRHQERPQARLCRQRARPGPSGDPVPDLRGAPHWPRRLRDHGIRTRQPGRVPELRDPAGRRLRRQAGAPGLTAATGGDRALRGVKRTPAPGTPKPGRCGAAFPHRNCFCLEKPPKRAESCQIAGWKSFLGFSRLNRVFSMGYNFAFCLSCIVATADLISQAPSASGRTHRRARGKGR